MWNPTLLSKNVFPAAAGSSITSLASTLATPRPTDNSTGLNAHTHHRHLRPPRTNGACTSSGPGTLHGVSSLEKGMFIKINCLSRSHGVSPSFTHPHTCTRSDQVSRAAVGSGVVVGGSLPWLMGSSLLATANGANSSFHTL